MWRGIVKERRAAAPTAVGAAGQKQDLLGFLLQAQQQQGAEVITDEMIGDEIKTMMFGGSDTSSFTMAMVRTLLQQHASSCYKVVIGPMLQISSLLTKAL